MAQNFKVLEPFFVGLRSQFVTIFGEVFGIRWLKSMYEKLFLQFG